ncbi:serine/threonine-protein kinase [Stigmatella sp. ncwal1]|uniref:Serine/threonine-protein kinase n=1 Tax=Stigmatella ashevillensis TaxID=2995309 RepID=A0ABT5DHB4_9BACT|nr:serine/threonine-protein kinase [Stigmatella ashevillena]MDC0713003.1 serine/threonine-protein kinase [Stigmatella ashevillena]
MTDVQGLDTLGVGSRVGLWRLERLAGRGSFGRVFQARRDGEPQSEPVALKVALAPEDARYAREVELLSRLRHAAVPALVDRGQWHPEGGAQYPFLVMQWVEGLRLYDWARVYDPTSRQLMKVLAQVARALEALEAVGGVHRDVKGDNILVGSDGRASLMDFGSGTWMGAPLLTQGMPPSTAEYQAPEAIRFSWYLRWDCHTHYEARASDDIYALGVTAYRVVTGRYPPPGTDPMGRHQGQQVPVPKRSPVRSLNACVAPELEALIERMLSPVAEARPRAREVAEAAEAAAAQAGTEADVPMLAGNRFMAKGDTGQARLRLTAPRVMEWLAAASVSALMILGAWWGVHERRFEAAPLAMDEEWGEGGPQEARTTGLADAGLSELAGSAGQPVTLSAVGLDMPRKPFRGQIRPDGNGSCPRKAQLAVNGGCWVALRDVQPPCGGEGYEWKGGCYYPVYDMPRQPTSELP